MTVRVVDVSAFQPHDDWARVAAAGYAGAIAKCSEGATWLSPVYRAQIAGARAAGLVVGAYHFFRTSSDPITQARIFVEHAGAVDLPLALDIEDQHPGDPLGGLTPADFCEHVYECLSEIAQLTGRRPLAYVEPSTWARLPAGQAAEAAALADLWVATYGPTPHMPHGWSDWTLWQYSDRESVPGIGPDDVSLFNGSLDDLRAYADGCPDTDRSPASPCA